MAWSHQVTSANRITGCSAGAGLGAGRAADQAGEGTETLEMQRTEQVQEEAEWAGCGDHLNAVVRKRGLSGEPVGRWGAIHCDGVPGRRSRVGG